MIVVCDIETERLENPEKIWVIVAIDVDSGKEYVFKNPTGDPKALSPAFSTFAKQVDVWIGHNFLGFDYLCLNRLVPDVHIDQDSIVDTLVTSRYLNFRMEGGHSLETWGERLKFKKLHLDISFSEYSEELVERCIGDCRLNLKVYSLFLPYYSNEELKDSLRVEHEVQLIANDMHSNGFYFKYEDAEKLYREIEEEIKDLNEQLQSSFPPKSRLVRLVTPKETKFGTISKVDFRGEEDLSAYSVGATFSRIEWVEFNPGSSRQRVEVLNDAGWRPTDKTKGHKAAEEEYRKDPTPENKERLDHMRIYGWRTSEENLDTLPEDAPESARKLVRWLLINARLSTLREWFNAYNKETHRIHGEFNHIGAWTGRMSHARPNMGNTPSVDSKYNSADLKALAKEFGTSMRRLWSVPAGRRLVGTDADGIQARVLAHYLNDTGFTTALIEGDSEKGTDIHTLNWNKLKPFCKSRANAKTFYYAWLLGAGAAKVAAIFGCTISEAREAIKIFIDSYPGLRYLKEEQIPRDARNGFFRGFDGRKVAVSRDPSEAEYLMLGGYLQNGEACVMKHANVRWRYEVSFEGLYFRQVNFIHDEWQTEVNDVEEEALRVGQIQQDSIRQIGEEFGLNCPMKGNSKYGYNWMETH